MSRHRALLAASQMSVCGGGGKVVNNIYQSFVEYGPEMAFIITSEYPVTSMILIYDGYGVFLTGIHIGNTQSDNCYLPVDTTSTYIIPTEDDTYIYNLVKD